jgi:hypothetical protein
MMFNVSCRRRKWLPNWPTMDKENVLFQPTSHKKQLGIGTMLHMQHVNAQMNH